ncbi:Plp2 protein [Starmerella bacillaris]|uniref:Plp2 protein n=1 Tax=Starmerella bacillaris TaxID=1247836 RepID=A0AAV5RN94_STABA|nr:Plp2 protein [Starmerella bacillaris]
MQDPNEDTEWNDILRQTGVLPPRPPSPTAEIEAAFDDAVQKAYDNRLEGKTVRELDELDEDGLEDEDFIQMYREKRMQEIRDQLSKEKYGEVIKINKSEYKTEITEASNSCPVIVHISSSQSTQSRLLQGLLLRIAPKFREIKFVEIDSKQINERFPDSQTPTVLVYKDEAVTHQLVTLSLVGGNSTSINDFEQYLVKCDVLSRTDSRLVDNEDED